MKKCIPVIATTLSIIAGTTLAASNLTSQADKASYAIGYKTGQAMKSRGVEINTDTFAKALAAGYNGKKSQMSEKEMQSTLATMQKEMVTKLKAKIKKLGEKNAVAGKKFLTTNAKKPGVVTTASGLQYKVLTKGSGTTPSPKDSVTVNYKGTLINGNVFDSSYQRGKPATFKVNQVIKGWQEALTKMKPGATWMLYIPAKLAYGSQGSFGKIGPNETLIFKVNLISVNK